MAAVVGITMVKTFSYRGVTEEWSNQYHLSGTIPADNTAWMALYTALATAERGVLPGTHSVIRGYGYNTDALNAPAVWSYDGTGTPLAGLYATNPSYPYAPGDAAAWVRWKTSRLNTKGKPIYLRKYFHGVKLNGTGGGDSVDVAQRTAYDALGTKLMDGTFLDGRTIRSRANAETILSRSSSPYVTTRTLKRRGKRPTG